MKWSYVPVFAALILPVSAIAQSTDAASFNALDANGDHMISSDEAQTNPQLASEFSQADTNNDGSLSMDEYQVAMNADAGDSGSSQGNANQ